ncbi:hypothetical protein N7504_003753 [Penicillium tannophilum]|nr:hypothetical protein N7504_003753 [Penicillium tannophilum]
MFVIIRVWESENQSPLRRLVLGHPVLGHLALVDPRLVFFVEDFEFRCHPGQVYRPLMGELPVLFFLLLDCLFEGFNRLFEGLLLVDRVLQTHIQIPALLRQVGDAGLGCLQGLHCRFIVSRLLNKCLFQQYLGRTQLLEVRFASGASLLSSHLNAWRTLRQWQAHVDIHIDSNNRNIRLVILMYTSDDAVVFLVRKNFQVLYGLVMFHLSPLVAFFKGEEFGLEDCTFIFGLAVLDFQSGKLVSVMRELSGTGK